MTLIEAYDNLFSRFRPYFRRVESYKRARAMAYSHVVTYGRHTITRMICSKNEQYKDWSADYKFFSSRQWQAEDLAFELFKECDRHSSWYKNSIVAVMDSSQRKKTGKKIPGVRTLRDPMSLPFHTNLVPSLRFLQASFVVNPNERVDTARAIPVCFQEASPAKRPRKNAPEEVKEQFKKEQKAGRISVVAHQAALKMREQVDELENGMKRLLFLSVDGGFCNKNFLRNLPENIIPIARTRKDIKLFKPFDSGSRAGRGRNRVYGDRLPTPEQIRKSDDYPCRQSKFMLRENIMIFVTRQLHRYYGKTARDQRLNG